MSVTISLVIFHNWLSRMSEREDPATQRWKKTDHLCYYITEMFTGDLHGVPDKSVSR